MRIPMTIRSLCSPPLFVLASRRTSSVAQQAPPAAAVGATNAPFWAGMTDAAAFERAMDARLAHAASCSTSSSP